MRNLQLNIIEKKKKKKGGWRGGHGRLTEIDLIIWFFWWSNSQTGSSDCESEFLPEWCMLFNWSLSQGWTLLQTLSAESGFKRNNPHHPSALPSELFSKNQHRLILTLLGVFPSPNWDESGKSHGRADLSSLILCAFPLPQRISSASLTCNCSVNRLCLHTGGF